MDVCQNCGKTIRIQIFKGEAWCSELCRKALVKRIDDADKQRVKDWASRQINITVNRTDTERVEPSLANELYYKTKQALKEHYGDH